MGTTSGPALLRSDSAQSERDATPPLELALPPPVAELLQPRTSKEIDTTAESIEASSSDNDEEEELDKMFPSLRTVRKNLTDQRSLVKGLATKWLGDSIDKVAELNDKEKKKRAFPSATRFMPVTKFGLTLSQDGFLSNCLTSV